jgi:hypothetical protein
MQVTARIMLPSARDGQHWQGQWRSQLTGDVWDFAGLDLQSRHKGPAVPWAARATQQRHQASSFPAYTWNAKQHTRRQMQTREAREVQAEVIIFKAVGSIA